MNAIELDLLARTVYGEARGESFVGKLAVACVIVNRAMHPRWWGNDLMDVCLKPKQFSCWNDGDPNRAKCHAATTDDPVFIDCLVASRAAMGQLLPDPTKGSDHYHTRDVWPAWASGHECIATIGTHLFYRLELEAVP